MLIITDYIFYLCHVDMETCAKPKPAVTSQLLNKVEITVKTYPDLQPFLEMAVLILEGVYEHMAQVSSAHNASPPET